MKSGAGAKSCESICSFFIGTISMIFVSMYSLCNSKCSLRAFLSHLILVYGEGGGGNFVTISSFIFGPISKFFALNGSLANSKGLLREFLTKLIFVKGKGTGGKICQYTSSLIFRMILMIFKYEMILGKF